MHLDRPLVISVSKSLASFGPAPFQRLDGDGRTRDDTLCAAPSCAMVQNTLLERNGELVIGSTVLRSARRETPSERRERAQGNAQPCDSRRDEAWGTLDSRHGKETAWRLARQSTNWQRRQSPIRRVRLLGAAACFGSTRVSTRVTHKFKEGCSRDLSMDKPGLQV